MKDVFFICLTLYVVASIIGIFAVWYNHATSYKFKRISDTLYAICTFILIGTAFFATIFAVLITNNAW